MTVDADITGGDPAEHAEEMRAGFAEMRTGFAEVHADLRDLREHVGALELRLGTVERVVVAMSRELAHLWRGSTEIVARDHP